MKKVIFLFFAVVTVAGSFNTHTAYAALSVADTTRKKVKPQVIFPVPAANISRLFYIQRDPTTSTIIYELNMKNGQLNEDEPVHPYWIKYSEKSQHDELNYIQRKFAYGLTQKKIAAEKFDIRFVSYKKLALTLMKGADAKYHIFAQIGQKQAILNRIFVRIEGGSFWIPNILYAELRGTDPTTGLELVERFKP